MFRVYDTKEQCWLCGDYYISQYGDLFSSEEKMFGNVKLHLKSDNRYIWQQDIGYFDKNDQLIFEGDICEITVDDTVIVCVVAYIPERAAYMLLDYKYNAYYQFYDEVKELISVVGNVCENQNLIEFEQEEEEEVDE